MRAKHRLGVTVCIAIAAAFFLWQREERPAPSTSDAPGALESAPRPERSEPPELAVDLPAAPGESALPPPVDLDAADRDLDLFGRVVDAEGAPVAGAAIESIHRPGRRTSLLDPTAHAEAIVDATTRSAQDGTFAIRLARGDLRELRVTHPDYAETAVPACQAGERVEIVLHPGARIELHAVDEGGASVDDVQVRLWYRTPATISFGDRRSSTDERGVADIRGLAPGRVFVAVEHATLGSPRWSDIALAAGETIVHEVVMPAGRTVTGTVVDRASGRPIAGARVGEGWTMGRVSVTDALGRYRLAGVTTLELFADADGYGREQAGVADRESTDPIDFELPPGDVVIGRVVDGTGHPVEGARVHAIASSMRPVGTHSESRAARTSTEGSFRLDSIHPDFPHTLAVRAPGSGALFFDFDGRSRDANRVIDLGTIALPAPAAIEGELVDEEGSPLAGESILLSGGLSADERFPGVRRANDASVLEEMRRADDLGRFRFPELSPGEYSLLARPAGRPEARETVQLAAGESEPRFVRLVSRSGPRFRIAVETAEGAPVPGTWVTATGGTDRRRVTCETDAEGIAAFAGLPGPVSIQVRSPAGWMFPGTFTIDPRDQLERIVLLRTATISGVLLASDGAPMPSLSMQATQRPRAGAEPLVQAHSTGADGAFEFTVEEGAIVDLACHGVRWAATGPLDLRTPQWLPFAGSWEGIRAPAAGLRLELEAVPADRTLAVRVTGPGGEPQGAHDVWALGTTTSIRHAAAKTDDEGLARLGGLPGLEVEIYTGLPAGSPGEGLAWIAPAPLRLVPDGREVTLQMRVGGLTRILAVDAAGAAVDGLLIQVRTSQGRDIHLVAGPGGVAIPLLADETADLTVDAVGRDGKRYRGELRGVAGGTREARVVVRGE